MNKPRNIVSHFAGSVYPESRREAIDYFAKALKAGEQPKEIPLHQPPVIIVPHIDLRVNLSCYSAAYKRLGHSIPFSDTYIILGVGHKCPHNFSSIDVDYETILGKVETDHDLWNFFKQQAEIPIERAPASFNGEHSIEFVVIWLQAIREILGIKKPFKIIPILMGGLFEEILEGHPPRKGTEFHQFQQAFKKTVDSLNPSTTSIIASIDGCHVGPRFDHPFKGNEKAQQVVTAWEAELWNYCSTPTFDSFFQHLHKVGNQFYFDGVGVLTLLLQSYSLKAHIDSRSLWYEKSDESFVTFSGGCMTPA